MLSELPVMDVCPWRYWATHSPQAVALRTESDTLNWQQLAHCVAQRAAYLAECGVSEGCAMALIGRNSPALLLNYLAVIECGARVVPVNPQLPRERQVALCAALDVRFGIAMPAIDGEMNAETAVVDAFDSACVEMLTAPLLFSVMLFSADAAHSASSAANATL
ncbi:MAG: AMP-binding protein, partial [Plesiomonas shigelloides]